MPLISHAFISCTPACAQRLGTCRAHMHTPHTHPTNRTHRTHFIHTRAHKCTHAHTHSHTHAQTHTHTHYRNAYAWLMVLGAISAFMASWGIGANDVANSFATSGFSALACFLNQPLNRFSISDLFEFFANNCSVAVASVHHQKLTLDS